MKPKLIEFPGIFWLIYQIRGVAQLGRALTSGVRGRRFESSHPDHEFLLKNLGNNAIFYFHLTNSHHTTQFVCREFVRKLALPFF